MANDKPEKLEKSAPPTKGGTPGAPASPPPARTGPAKASPAASKPPASLPKSTGPASVSPAGAGGTGPSGGGPAAAKQLPVAGGSGPKAAPSAGAGGTGPAAPKSGAPAAAGTAGKAGAAGAAGTSGAAGAAKGALPGAGQAADLAKGGGAGAGGVGVGGMAGSAVEGNNGSNVRRYAGKAVAGGVDGAMTGGLHGAVIGAAKEVGVEALKDTAKGVVKATGGSPVATPAEPGKNLGVGGTSYERGGKADQDGIGTKLGKAAAVAGGASAAPPAVGVVMAMAFLNWLKSMFFAAMAMAANFGKLAWMLVLQVIKSVAHAVAAPFIAVGSFVANVTGAVTGVAVTAAVAPAVAVGTGVMSTVAAVALVGTVITGVIDTTALADGRMDNGSSCVVAASSQTGGDGAGADVTANAEANAKIVFSVLSDWGMSKENIAGILGNWSQESGIDPTSVESIYDEPYQIGPRKQAAWDGDFTQIPGQSHGGIGLGQWSNGRTTQLLDFATAKGKPWYAIETQLAFMISGDSGAPVVKDMIKTSQGSPSAAAVYFHSEWERSADGAQGISEREADAEMWFGKMSGWQVDQSVVGGVQDIVGDIIDGIGTGINTILGNCGGGAGSVAPKNGGMTQEEAQALIDLFNQEGDKFLDGRYGAQGGPGSCGDNHAENCVSFSTYFVNKYTTFQTYPMGNGIDTAGTIASQTGKQLSSTPTPYAVGSGPGSGDAGHTLVVLGVQGDQVIVGEAGYCSFMGRVRVTTVSALAADGWQFVDMSDAMLPADQIKTA